MSPSQINQINKNITTASMVFFSVPYAILPSLHQTKDEIEQDGNTTTVHRSIFSLLDNKHYEWKNMLKGLSGSWCVGSSHGWLILLDKNALPIILNPFSATRIHLPRFPHTFRHPNVSESYFIKCLRKSFIVKAALMCSSASHSQYILVIIYGCEGKLAFCKSASATWDELSDARHSYCDVVFNNNYLYALAQDGSVEGWDICQNTPRKILDVKPTMDIDVELSKEFPGALFSRQIYLVESKGEVLLVVRYIGNFVNDDGVAVDEGYLLSSEDTHPLLCPYRTKHFCVYKLDFRGIKWEKMGSLLDRVLFLGANESISMSVQGFSGCEPNSIYFTDDRWDEMSLDYLYGGHDWGFFNLQDKSIKPLSPCAYKLDPPPIWVIPLPIAPMTC